MDWRTLDSKINSLDLLVNGPSMFIPDNWPRLWGEAKEIQEGFRGVKFPSRDDHQRAWERFNAIRDEMSRRSQDQKKERFRRSDELKSEILSEVESARPNDLFGFSPVNVEHMKMYGRVLKEAGQMLSRHKQEMLGEHKQECFGEIQKMHEVHDAWWESLGVERAKSQADQRARTLANIERNKERYRKTSEALAKTRDFISRISDDIANAWNDDWKSDAEGRLADAESRADDMENSLREIERWIEEDEQRL